jgi:hypothetical protein
VELAYAQPAPGGERQRDLVEQTREVIAARFNEALTLTTLGRVIGS